MTMVSGRARRARLVLIPALAFAALAFSAGGALAAPPVAFSLAPSGLSFGDTFINAVSGPQSVTVTVGRKAVVLDVQTLNGTFVDTHTGTCYTTWAYQVPANTSCTIDVEFAPFVAGAYSTELTVDSCMKWHADVNDPTLPRCDRIRDSAVASLDGTALNLP